ncbi:2-C-methyl-D-erythritol 4-phosphate cytidylyltransferase [Demequina mangrovi]|uniref:2-C-methyl-D-erythritol 4-phosphate cytidylyltransferase n=1 Tax=Demequina mangrovi TaxID=1043493 RepID=A0A1H6YN11_9MICO|nr:2-C-methyl-D-erythritol 4-phosphate cytidylyltransferase [Demequina mangrovi]SEJ38632.1 2-C-methyl-D-erythritol 4-phosphate cytidylyltransferase [Demequina mangrovi]
MTVAAVVTAAGYGTRLGSDLPKALVAVAGEPLVAHAVRRIARVATRVVVTAPPTHLEDFARALAGVAAAGEVRIVPGAGTRQESVNAGLAALGLGSHDIVLVHDAARAFQPVEAMRAVIDAIEAGADGAIPVVPVVDTLVTAPDPDGALGAPVDRTGFRIVQTPQGFRAAALLDAHARGGSGATDDATLARELGYRVVATEGHEWGVKVTHAGDLALAEHIAALSAEQETV